MKKFDNYDSFLKLTNRMSENSTPIGNIVQVSNPRYFQKQKPLYHPTVLNGLRNKNNQSYKTLCSPSKVFDYSDIINFQQQNVDQIFICTHEITQNQKNKYEASERKRQIEANSLRTINPSVEKFNSPKEQRVQSSTRQNVSQESMETQQYFFILTKNQNVKACMEVNKLFLLKFQYKIETQKIFLDYVYLKIIGFQSQNKFTNQLISDVNEEYGNSRTHKKSQSINTFVNLQTSPIQNECFQIYTERSKATQYEDNFRHLLTSYQKANQMKNEGKKKYPQSRLIYEQTKLVEQQVLKPYNKVFQQSQKEQNVKQNKKGQGDQFLNQQKSNFKIY